MKKVASQLGISDDATLFNTTYLAYGEASQHAELMCMSKEAISLNEIQKILGKSFTIASEKPGEEQQPSAQSQSSADKNKPVGQPAIQSEPAKASEGSAVAK